MQIRQILIQRNKYRILIVLNYSVIELIQLNDFGLIKYNCYHYLNQLMFVLNLKKLLQLSNKF